MFVDFSYKIYKIAEVLKQQAPSMSVLYKCIQSYPRSQSICQMSKVKAEHQTFTFKKQQLVKFLFVKQTFTANQLINQLTI